MSIVTLKRKSQQIKTLSGKSPNSTMVISGPSQPYPFTTGGGFTLHGKERNIGYIGKNSMNSSGGTKMRPGTSTWKGNGGNGGNYIVNPTSTSQCCVNNIGVKPSVLNTKGMLANKNRWSKTTIPDTVFTSQGFESPSHNQLQHIYNNWVSNNSTHYNMKNSAKQHTENLVTVLTYNNPSKSTSSIKPCFNNPSNSTSSIKQCFNSGYHIGGRYIPPKPYAKYLNHTGTASNAMSTAISKRAAPFPKGYDRPFPTVSPIDQCQPYYTQASDPTILNTYYYDQNNTSIFPC
jgi:hypothetical protein